MSDFTRRMAPSRIAYHEARGEWPCASLTRALAERARATPDRILFVSEDDRVTARELARRVDLLSGALAALGLRAGDVVSWQMPNWVEGVVLTFALDRLGAVSNPILPIFREAEVTFIARQVGTRLLIVPGILRGFDHRELAATVRRASPRLEWVAVARGEPLPGQMRFEDLTVTSGLSGPGAPFGPHDVSSVFYTSGTTAEPKGVLHTTSTLGSFLRIYEALIPDIGSHVGILWFPLTHIGGIASFGILPVLNGSRAVFLDAFHTSRALDLIERERVTSAGGPPALLQALLASREFSPERVASVRMAGLGAADVSPELMRSVAEGFDAFVYRAYGLTECPLATTGRLEDAWEQRVGTDGRPSLGVKLRVVDGQSGEVGPGEEGEIELFGPQLCAGYVDPALNAEGFTLDGFLETGDLGVRSEDGFVRVTGRKKDIIIRKGENLSAKGIEDVLHEHPAIEEAAVVGLPDARSGERVCACVVLRAGKALVLSDLRSFLLDRGLMVQKVPEQLELLDALPRNALGKVKKQELRNQFG